MRASFNKRSTRALFLGLVVGGLPASVYYWGIEYNKPYSNQAAPQEHLNKKITKKKSQNDQKLTEDPVETPHP